MNTVSLVAVGDICLGDHYFTLGHGTGSQVKRGRNPFDELAHLLFDADICIGNLEGPLAPVSIVHGEPEAAVFRGPPEAASLLSKAGFDLLHVANNHILQHGVQAFEACINGLGSYDIDPIGLSGETGSSQAVFRDVEGLRLGFVGYSLVTERHVPGQTCYASAPLPDILNDIEALRDQVEAIVVSVHWGREGARLPTSNQVESAHRMVEAGATLVLGHHPHVFQPIERTGRSLIAYSLGDLVFDLFWDRRLIESALLRVELDESGVVSHTLSPVYFDRSHRVRFQSKKEAERFLRDLGQCSRLLAGGQHAAREHPGQIRISEMLRKLMFFAVNFFRGDTRAKATFFGRKLLSLASAPFSARPEGSALS